MAMTYRSSQGARDGESGSQPKFHLGDKVHVGRDVGIITDLGSVLIQVKTTDGRLRVACPWELKSAPDMSSGRK
jgi:hypothetical protein